MDRYNYLFLMWLYIFKAEWCCSIAAWLLRARIVVVVVLEHVAFCLVVKPFARSRQKQTARECFRELEVHASL